MSCEASFTAKDFLVVAGALMVLLMILLLILLSDRIVLFLSVLLTLVIGWGG